MSVKYADHAQDFFNTAHKHLNTGHGHAEFQRGFAAGIRAAAENIKATTALSFANDAEAKQFALDAAADMEAKAGVLSK